MLNTFLKRFGWMCVLVLIQALILNNVRFLGYATPFLYVYLLLKFNADMSRYALLLWGFALGLAVDIFSNTPGVNAAATTLLAFTRPMWLKLFTPRDCADDMEPGYRNMGPGLFIRYIFVGLLIHQSVFIILLTFSFAQPGIMALQVLCSALLTTICIAAIEAIRR